MNERLSSAGSPVFPHWGERAVVFLAVAVLTVLLLGPGALAAQIAPELSGRVREITGAPIAGALVELANSGARTWSDATGDFRLRAPEAGRFTVRITRLGYTARSFDVKLEAGRQQTLDASLAAEPIRVDSVIAIAETNTQAITLTRAAIVRSGAATIADAIAAVPGVVVAASTPGGPQRVSIRGAEARQVLVLLDGVPLNDPVTGEADLSRIRAEHIEQITVTPGGASARYGARAVGGVVALETRRGGGSEMALSAGSLGSVSAALNASRAGSLEWSTGVSAQHLDGKFDYDVAGLRGTRENADARSLDAFAHVGWQGSGGGVQLRAAAQQQRRGMPGTAFAPSGNARQFVDAWRVGAQWDARARFGNPRALFSYNHETVRFADPQPPAGLPYDDTLTLSELFGRIALQNDVRALRLATMLEARAYSIDAQTLEADRPAPGTVSFGTELKWPRAAANTPWSAQLAGRIDYDHAQAHTYPAHELSVGYDAAVHLRLAHRSSYAPPTLADQHFRESFGVAANPNLRAERVPSEIEASAAWSGAAAGVGVSARASAWSGDTDDLIVWSPDYRFIWSPRNVDVRRRGADGSLSLSRGVCAVEAGWSYTRVTYRALPQTVQVLYRPRNTGTLAVHATSARWQARIETLYIGTRTTAATQLNTLPGFWTVNASAGARATLHSYSLAALLSVDRLNNERESLIFGFPQPARLLRLELRVSPRVQS